MISYHKGDLLESGCDIICHQVNMNARKDLEQF